MGKLVDLGKSKVAVSARDKGGVFIEFYIKTDYEEPLFYHDRLEGGITHTAVKIGAEATEALCALLIDHLKVLKDE